jgi:two-component system sensor histidine kinase KdpD
MVGTRTISKWPRPGPYAVALVATSVAVALSLALVDLADTLPELLFLAAVGVSGWRGGLGPALLSTSVGFLVLDYLFESPPYGFEVTAPSTLLSLIGFLVTSLLLGSLNAQLRGARARADRARVAAEAAVVARDEALAAVSHDLRTPLTAIKTSAGTLRDATLSLPEPVRKQLLANIEADADRLVRFVGAALALNRLERSVAPQREWNALGEVASAVLDRTAPLFGNRPLQFTIPDTLPLMQFDAWLLDQALGNVLENAALHTPPGTPVHLDAHLDGPDLRVVVADRGPGIPPEARERIFDKFERLDSTGPGAGLGLSIARAAVSAQGGQLWVETNPGGGARFVMLLPGVLSRSDGR